MVRNLAVIALLAMGFGAYRNRKRGLRHSAMPGFPRIGMMDSRPR
jgi:hypothetical protein